MREVPHRTLFSCTLVVQVSCTERCAQLAEIPLLSRDDCEGVRDRVVRSRKVLGAPWTCKGSPFKDPNPPTDVPRMEDPVGGPEHRSETSVEGRRWTLGEGVESRGVGSRVAKRVSAVVRVVPPSPKL